MDLVRVSDRVLDLAGSLLPVELRSLHAIHLATAERLGGDLGGLITYDQRMAALVSDLDHRVSAPS